MIFVRSYFSYNNTFKKKKKSFLNTINVTVLYKCCFQNDLLKKNSTNKLEAPPPFQFFSVITHTRR